MPGLTGHLITAYCVMPGLTGHLFRIGNQSLSQIQPMWIHGCNELIFPFSFEMFELFFPLNSLFNIWKHLKINEFCTIILSCKG